MKKRPMTLLIEEDLIDFLNQYAKQYYTNKTAIIRSLIVHLMYKTNKKTEEKGKNYRFSVFNRTIN